MSEEYKQEIERLTKQNKALNETYELTKKEYIRLNNIIKEVRELRKHLAFEYYDNGLEVGVNCVIEDLDKILGVDKE